MILPGAKAKELAPDHHCSALLEERIGAAAAKGLEVDARAPEALEEALLLAEAERAAGWARVDADDAGPSCAP